MAYNLAQMRKLFASGRLKAARIAPCTPGQPGQWNLVIERADGVQVVMTVDRSPRPKIYKSLEAAAADASRVGFNEVALKVA